MGERMKKNKVFQKMITIGCLLIFLSSAIAPFVISATTKKDLQPEDNATNYSTESTSIRSASNYYAVIAACSRYENPAYNIPKLPYPFPFSEKKLLIFYETLIQSENWKNSTIIVLINENATKQNIIDALSYIATIIGPEDYFLFSWSGHGSQVPDIDGDELVFDPNDTKDEVICPYDTKKQDGIMYNVITDDELDSYFSAIDCKGMCLIFDCCLSGGMVDKTMPSDAQSAERQAINTFSTSLRQDLQRPQSSDVNADNRVIIMSTKPDHLARGIYLTGFPLTTGMAIACKHPRFSDRNNDGYISAEEAFAVAKPLVYLQSSLYWIGAWTGLYAYFKTLIGPGALIFATFEVLLAYFMLQAALKDMYDLSMGNFPMMQDDYPGEFPLIIL